MGEDFRGSLYFEDKIEEINKIFSNIGIDIDKQKMHVQLPERYIINNSACILFWKDGTKTVVKRCADDEFNPRLAFLTAFWQHYCRNEQKQSK